MPSYPAGTPPEVFFAMQTKVDSKSGQLNRVWPITGDLKYENYGFDPSESKPPRNAHNGLLYDLSWNATWARSQILSMVADSSGGAPIRIFAASNSTTDAKDRAHVTCDATDAHVDIQAEIDALVAGGALGGVLFFSSGTYSFGDTESSNVNVPANFHIVGSGWNTVFKYGSNTPGSHDALLTLNGTNVGVKNIWFNGTSNTNNTHFLYVKGPDCLIDHCYFEKSGGSSVFLYNAHRLHLTRSKFLVGTSGVGGDNHGIQVANLADTWYASYGVHVHHNVIQGDSAGVLNQYDGFNGKAPNLKFYFNDMRYLNDGVHLIDSEEVEICHNEFRDPVSDAGDPTAIHLVGCYKARVVDNNLQGDNAGGTNTAKYGIWLKPNGSNRTLLANILDNKISGFKSHAIIAQVASLLDGNSDRYSNNKIMRNEINNNDGCGIWIETESGGTYAPVFCNVSYNDIHRNGQHGMNLEVAYSDINYNTLYANGTTAGTWCQIRVGNVNSTEKPEHNTIVGNKAHQGQPTNKCTYGLWLDATTQSADNNCVWGNDMRSASTSTTLKNDGTGNQTLSQSGTLSTQNWT